MIELSDSHGSLLQWLVASSYIVGDLAVTQTFIFCVRLLVVSILSVTSDFWLTLIGWTTLSLVVSIWFGFWASLLAFTICKHRNLTSSTFGWITFVNPYIASLLFWALAALVNRFPPLENMWLYVVSLLRDGAWLGGYIACGTLTLLLVMFVLPTKTKKAARH